MLGLFYPNTRPDFLILGTQRGGTTSLFNYLNAHPQIQLPIIKEIHYFDLQSEKSPNWYFAHFPIRYPYTDIITGEASPYYLFHPDVPKRVANLLPDVRPIVFLREPIARAYSHYQYNYKLGIEQRSFENAVHDEIQLIESGKRISIEDIDHHRHFSYISRGLYLEQLNHWLNYFPREKMYISLSEEFFDNPQVVVKDLFAFLNVEILELSQSLFVPYNHNSYRIEVADELRQYLKKIYSPFNEQLAAQLDLDLRLWQE